MKSKITGIIITILVLSVFPVLAQEAILEYFEDPNEESVILTDDEEFYFIDIDMGFELPQGSRIITAEEAYAEISFGNGAIIKLSGDTDFTIDELQTEEGGENVFTMAMGKFRTVAGRATGDEKYTFNGPSAVCGVRGTDFGMDVPITGGQEAAFVLDGLIDYTNSAGETISLATGQMADALGDIFEAIEIPPAYLEALMADLEFEELDPTAVPGHEPALAEVEPEDGMESAAVDVPVLEDVPAGPPEVAAGEGEGGAPGEGEVKEGLFELLKKLLGMEIGSVTIGGETYSKAIIQPTFTVGSLRMGLYLPIIYKTDLFNPDDWYHPEGNDEWSFGTDKKHGDIWIARVFDFMSDLALKIKFLQFGFPRDPFFIKLGNLNDITIGHGIVMRNFANDADFPTVRRVGLNLGLDFTKIGLELMVNDLAKPEIFGGRFYIKPFAPLFKLALGFSGIADINPVVTLKDPTGLGKPILIGGGVDLDLPFVVTQPFSLIAFADAAAMIPYLGEAIPNGDTEIPAGLQINAVYNPGGTTLFEQFKNFGIATGLMGNIFIYDWRLEARFFNGTFKPAFFNNIYERVRGEYAKEVAEYLKNPTDSKYENLILGVFGEGGFVIPDIFSMDFGYMWPWSFDENNNIVMSDEDYLHFGAKLERGVIPVVDIAASFAYDRMRLVTPFLAENADTNESSNVKDFNTFLEYLFNQDTVMKAEVLYGIAPTLDIAFLVSLALERDSDGFVVYDENNIPKIGNTITVETRLHF